MIKKSTTVRMLIIMLQAVCLFLVFSSVSNADTSEYKMFGDGNNACQTCTADCKKNYPPTSQKACIKEKCKDQCAIKLNQQQAVTIVQYALIPIQFLITYVAYIMGFFFLAWGLYRLRHGHEGGGYNRQHSGAGTVLCFLAATMIFQYQWTTKMVGNSLLGPSSVKNWRYGESGALPVDPVNLFGYVSATNSGLRDGGLKDEQGDGILQSRNWNEYSDNQQAFITLQTLFAVLMIVGYISFLRGAMLLVKMGEGSGGGESSGTKAVVHIVAAGLLCNANHVTALINNLSTQVNIAGN